MTLGPRLTRLRLDHDQSLQQVADAVGVSKAHIWELEKGRTANPSIALVKGLAGHFGVTIDDLVGEAPQRPQERKELARLFREAKDLTAEDLSLLEAMAAQLRKRKDARGG
mgnify:CR=1 FL=1